MTPSPDKTPDLLPCPFCGGDPQTDYWDVGKPMHTVECRACFGMCYSSDNEKAAIKSWNTRTPPVLAQQGWACPHCNTVHNPKKQRCECQDSLKGRIKS